MNLRFALDTQGLPLAALAPRGPSGGEPAAVHFTVCVSDRQSSWKGQTNTGPTWRTEAPLWRNWRPLSAESMPPVAMTGNPGRARAMADTALKAMGLTAMPAGRERSAVSRAAPELRPSVSRA